MKRAILILFCFVFFVSSCSNNQSKNEATDNTEKAATKSGESNEFKNAKDCDEFIDQYEKWMDNYLVLIEKYMKNPMDADLMQQFLKVSQESMNWVNQWNGKLALCAGEEKYEKRFNDISEKAEKKLKEMGIE